MRHLRKCEKPCEPCLEANRERASAAPSGFTNYEREMAKVLEKNPPVIVWKKDKHGIQRAVSVKDPHAEASIAAQAQRMRRSAESLSGRKPRGRQRSPGCRSCNCRHPTTDECTEREI